MIRQLLKFAIGCLILLAAAYLLNPSPDKHRAAISEQVSARSELAGLLRLGRVTAFFSEYHSLAVASYTTVNDRVVSIGAFGIVHVREPAATQGTR